MSFAACDGSFRPIDMCISTGARVFLRVHILTCYLHGIIEYLWSFVHSQTWTVYVRHLFRPVTTVGDDLLSVVSTTCSDPLFSSVSINRLSKTRGIGSRLTATTFTWKLIGRPMRCDPFMR